MDATQLRLRQSLRDAIAKYRARQINLNDLLTRLSPIIEDLQPENVWEQAEELYTELDVFYGLHATGEAISRHGHDFPLTAEQQRNVDRIVGAIDRLLAS